MNPIHMMTGKEAYELGEKAHEIAQKRILAHWHILQTRYGAQNESPFSFDRWRIVWVSPMLGVRETHRLVGQYVLREQDLDSGLRGQVHDDVIALADHSIDFTEHDLVENYLVLMAFHFVVFYPSKLIISWLHVGVLVSLLLEHLLLGSAAP